MKRAPRRPARKAGRGSAKPRPSIAKAPARTVKKRPVKFGPRTSVRPAPPAEAAAPFPSFAEAAYTFEMQESRGTLSILGPRRFPLLERFWIEVELADGDVHTSVQSGLRAGPGHWLAEVANGRIHLELTLKRSTQPAGILLAVTVRNRGTEPLDVRQVRVARAALGRERESWGPIEEWRLLRLGYTFGGAHGEDPDPRNSALISFTEERVTAKSWGAAAIRFGGTAQGLVAGFTSSDRQLAWLEIRKDRAEIDLAAVCELEGAPIAPGGATVTETLFLGLVDDVTAGLAEYARLVARQMKVRLKPAPRGWCSWYGYRHDRVTEDVVLAHAAFIAERKGRLPLEVVQLDDGYATAPGDWLSLNARFPAGLEALAKGIRARGLVPGIWVAPFLASASSAIFKAHPEWMVRDDTGQPAGRDVEWAVPKEPWYALDGSHPDVQRHLRDLFAQLRGWGYAYFKLDFLFVGCGRGHRAAPVTRVEAYRRGLAAIREGAGDAYLLGCTAPYPPTVGLVDGLRVSHDIHPSGDLWDTFAESMRETHQRGWAHGVLWNADHDVLLVRDVAHSGFDTARAVEASIELSGGALFAGDPLPDLPEDRLELVARALADRHAAAAVPMDLFDRDAPRLLVLAAGRKTFRVGVFNDSTVARSAALDLDRLGLPRARVFVLDGDERRSLGLHRKRVLTPPVPARGVTMLLIEGA